MAFEIALKLISGRKAVTPAGTAQKIVAVATGCYRVDLCADPGNTNPVAIGGSAVVALEGSVKGIMLIPGNPPITILTNDVSKIWVDSQTSGDSVCFTYYVP